MAAPPVALAGKGSRPGPVAKRGSQPPRRRSPGRRSRWRRLPLRLSRLGDAGWLLRRPGRILRRTPCRLGKTNRLDPYPPGWPGEVERTRPTREATTLVSGDVGQLRARHRTQGRQWGQARPARRLVVVGRWTLKQRPFGPAEQQRASICPKASQRPSGHIGGSFGKLGLRIECAIWAARPANSPRVSRRASG
jgi:hypothetical protein